MDSAGSLTFLAVRSTAEVARTLAWNFSKAYIWVLFTPLIGVITLHYGFIDKRWQKSLLVHVAAGLLTTTLVARILVGGLHYLGWNDPATPFRSGVLAFLTTDLPRYFVTVALIQIVLHYSALRIKDAESAKLEGQLASAQLEVLRAQLEPHFLFNTLNSIATLVQKAPASAERMILQLAALLRVSLDQAGSQVIPLCQELNVLQNYLEIQRVRFHDRLTISMNISPETLCLSFQHGPSAIG